MILLNQILLKIKKPVETEYSEEDYADFDPSKEKKSVVKEAEVRDEALAGEASALVDEKTLYEE